jgi:tetratricopeptide (TPR) repeat protein
MESRFAIATPRVVSASLIADDAEYLVAQEPVEGPEANDTLAEAARLLATQPDAALTEAVRILRADPDNVQALLLSAAALRLLGEPGRAAQAEHDSLRASMQQPAVAQAAKALNEGRADVAERLIRPHLAARPGDPVALRMIAAIARITGRHQEALPMLGRALELVPSYAPARQDLAEVFVKLSRHEEALGQADFLLAMEPEHPLYLELRANILKAMGGDQPAASD